MTLNSKHVLSCWQCDHALFRSYFRAVFRLNSLVRSAPDACQLFEYSIPSDSFIYVFRRQPPVSNAVARLVSSRSLDRRSLLSLLFSSIAACVCCIRHERMRRYIPSHTRHERLSSFVDRGCQMARGCALVDQVGPSLWDNSLSTMAAVFHLVTKQIMDRFARVVMCSQPKIQFDVT